uniref:Uncharacterized protein n=1 Tax=Arundo donax TaxID=35708 RepID=A0A0A9A7M0_ARUDO
MELVHLKEPAPLNFYSVTNDHLN